MPKTFDYEKATTVYQYLLEVGDTLTRGSETWRVVGVSSCTARISLYRFGLNPSQVALHRRSVGVKAGCAYFVDNSPLSLFQLKWLKPRSMKDYYKLKIE